MGMVDDDFEDACGEYGQGVNAEVNTVAQWMSKVDPAHRGFQFAYRYLQGGLAASGNGWYNQYPGNGGSLGNFASLCTQYGYLPVFIYYQIGQVNETYLSSATSMGQYFQDWSAAMSAINSWMNANPGKAVTVDVEPDLAGSIEQSGQSPSSQSVEVSAASNPGGSIPYTQPSQANTFQGYCQALLALKDHYVTGANNANCHIAFHVSSWANGTNPAVQPASLGAAQLAAQASAEASFLNACQSTSGSRFDLFFTDPSGYDGAYNSTYAWDSGGAVAAQYASWLSDLSSGTGLRSVLWQVPMGNSHMLNSLGHYQDLRPEYFLNDSPLNASGYSHNLCYYYNSGCIGILWGRGDYHGTGVMDYFYPANYAGSASQQDCSTYSGSGSWVSPAVVDDDAGFFRSHIANNASWGALCSGASPTPSFSPSPALSPTPTPTVTVTSACPNAVLDNFSSNSLTNAWGGAWSDYNPGSGSTMNPSPLVMTSGGLSPANYCAQISGSLSGTNYPSLSSFLNASETAQNACLYNGLQFAFNGTNGALFRCQIHSALEDSPTLSYNDYYFDLTGTGSWETISIPYTAFVFPGWGPTYSFECSQFRYISWLPLQAGTYSLAVDALTFACFAPSPTPSAMPSASITGSATPSRSPSSSPSSTQSPSSSPSHTPSPQNTGTPSLSPTPSASSSRSPTASPTSSVPGTATSSLTPSPSLSATESPFPGTATPTPDYSATPSPTGTCSASSSPTATRSPTTSSSLTPSPSGSPSPSLSASSSPGPSATPTSTRTPSLTPSQSTSPSPIPSETSSPTLRVSPSFSASPSPAATATPTPSPSPLALTATASPGSVPSLTPSEEAPGNSSSSAPVSTQILSVLPYPNPNPQSLYVKLAGACDGIEVRLYSRSMRLLAVWNGPGSIEAGWTTLSIRSGMGAEANGIYYYSVTVTRGGAAGRAYLGELAELR